MKQIILLASAISIAVGGLELLLRLTAYPEPVVSGWKASVRPGREINELGFRGRPLDPNDTNPVIVLVGDSQVETAYLPFGQMPERLLETALKRLGISRRVFSIGASGYGQDQELLALRDYFGRYRSTLVVLWQTPFNDFWNNTFPTHWPSRNGAYKPTFWLSGDRLEGPAYLPGVRLDSGIRLIALAQHACWPANGDASWEARLPPAYIPESNFTGPASDLVQELIDQRRGFLHGDDFVTEKCHLSICLAPRSPRTAYSVQLAKRLIGEIDDLCRRNGARLLLFRHDGISFDLFGERRPSSTYRIQGRYFHASRAQFLANLAECNGAFREFVASVPDGSWCLSDADDHLNLAALQDVMRQLGTQIAHLEMP